ncbi:hypothetical protein RHMOL_Rhmol07G0243000 [Rhododendron molle]|uniref:Uncharacterized protein n=3 Tax=Rhododendron molle TaxID=49168 RepID=A0ACC0N5A4_RHOML|nr:hypothetical protein RHMOL_Rhmol07G0243000 [Rhododendron molle]KAI8548058.1 hypothetical protein RHMOL_Rhmol07G0243000 [Rhododendron molle]KAI8548059.1 hypothetical protein RHMOL_Rhmol07G0243000 [Rhododendron molle]
MAIKSQPNSTLKISLSNPYQVSVATGLQICRSPFSLGRTRRRRGISSQLSMASDDLPPLRLNPRPGVRAGKAAVIEAVAVPSHQKDSHLDAAPDEAINSHIDLRPENCDLPPFEDWVKGTLPIKPWYIEGPVIKGFGRGSKMLGIPTANLSTEGYSAVLSEQRSGVYFGWAGLSTRGIYKMVMSVGWNPYFNNAEKTIEPWLLHEFGDDFYGEDLRLAVVGYIRPEANFPSLERLIEKIHEDRQIAETALEFPMYPGEVMRSSTNSGAQSHCSIAGSPIKAPYGLDPKGIDDT